MSAADNAGARRRQGRQPLADRGGGGARRLHGGARHHHRQCGAALHRGQSRRQPGRILLGGHNLSRLQRHHRHGHQLFCPEIRAQILLPVLPRPVHAQLGAVRLRLESVVSAVFPPVAGFCRRRHGSGRPVHPRRQLSAQQARTGFCAVRRRRGGGAGGRPDARRLAFRQPVLALVLPHQRPGRPRLDGADRRADQGNPADREGPAFRLFRLPADRLLPRLARSHSRPRPDRGLVFLRLHRELHRALDHRLRGDDPMGARRGKTRWWTCACSPAGSSARASW